MPLLAFVRRCLPPALFVAALSASALAASPAVRTNFNISALFAAHAVACIADPIEATLSQPLSMAVAPGCLADEPARPPWHKGDPPPPPSDPAKPDVLKDPKYEDWLDKTGVTGCDLDLYQTGSDLQRDPTKKTPEGQNPDPTGVTLATKKADGGCQCKVAIEAGWLATATPAERDGKVAHELCHCRQAKYGYYEWVDENGKPKEALKDPVGDQKLEDDASICADVLIGGGKPQSRPLYKPKRQVPK